MNTITEDIKDMLVADTSLQLVLGQNLFIGREPDKPDDTVTIFNKPSFPPETSLDSTTYFYSSFQIRIRSVKYNYAFNLAQKIFTSLHARAHETWNGVLYSVILGDEPVLLDWDDKNRVRVIINFETQRR